MSFSLHTRVGCVAILSAFYLLSFQRSRTGQPCYLAICSLSILAFSALTLLESRLTIVNASLDTGGFHFSRGVDELLSHHCKSLYCADILFCFRAVSFRDAAGASPLRKIHIPGWSQAFRLVALLALMPIFQITSFQLWFGRSC